MSIHVYNEIISCQVIEVQLSNSRTKSVTIELPIPPGAAPAGGDYLPSRLGNAGTDNGRFC